jgi:hypothetical protein
MPTNDPHIRSNDYITLPLSPIKCRQCPHNDKAQSISDSQQTSHLTMRICDISLCMSLRDRGDKSKVLLCANMLQTAVGSLTRPSILVIIGKAEKSLDTRTLFSI